MRHCARRSLTGAFVLLTIGTAFLLRNLGIIDPRTFDMWWPLLLIAVGVAMNLLSIRRHVRLVGELKRAQFSDRRPSRQAVILALFLALVGVAMGLYLTLA